MGNKANVVNTPLTGGATYDEISLPSGTRRFEIKTRDLSACKFKLGGNDYVSIPENASYDSGWLENAWDSPELSINGTAGKTAEVIYWT